MDQPSLLVPNVAEAAASVDAAPLAAPDLAANYAEDAATKEYIATHLVPVLVWTRSQRSGLEDEWEKVRAMVVQEHDEGQRYKGRSNVYIPSYSRARTTLTSQLTRGLFPSDEYMNTEGKDGVPEEDIRAAQILMKHQIENSARLRRGIKPFIRQLVDYGISVGKVYYQGPEENLRRVRRTPDLTALMYGKDERSDYRCEGLKFEPRNMFFWYVYPTTALSLEDAQVVFEDILVPLALIKRKVAHKQWLNGDVAENAPVPTQYNANLQRLLDAQADMSGTPDTNPVGGSDIAALRVVTEVWVAMPLPASAYAGDEEQGSPIPCKVVMAGDTPVEVRRNPFWDQTPPYVMARAEWEVQSFYPRGEGHKAKGLQYLVNDFSNQLNDNGTYALNPIVKVNPSLFTGPIIPLKPGVMWQGTDVSAMAEFDRPPVEQLQHGLQLVQHYDSMLENKVGSPPILQGTGTGKGGKTATVGNILQRNAMNPLQDQTEDLEGDVMVPFMNKGWAMLQQFMSADRMLALTGRDLKVSKEALDRDYLFKWLASSQAANQQMRAQQIMQLFGVVMVPAMMQLIAQQQRTFNPIPWLKRLASDGFGLRGFDQAFPAMAPQQVGQPGMPPGPPGAPGNGAQMPGTPPIPGDDMTPTNASPVAGEGDDFMAVRAQADQMAGMLGGKQ